MPKKYIGFILVLLLILSACIPSQEIEELAIISARGIDLIEENEVEKTLNVIRFDPEADGIYTTVSGIAKTLKGAREDAASHMGYKLSEGQLNLELYGKEAAQQGIDPYIASSVRDASVSDTMKLAVSNTTAKGIFDSDSDKAKEMGRYLDILIDKEVEEGSLPASTLQDYTRRATTIGQDGALPLIGLKDNEPTIIGMAVFQDYRYVLDISPFEGMLLNLFLHTLRNTPIEISIPIKPFKKYMEKDQQSNNEIDEEDDFSIHFIIIRGKSNTKVKNLADLTFQTDVDMEIDLLELSKTVRIKDEGIANLFVKEIEKKFQSQFEQLLKNVQEVSADPFGFGKIYRTKTKDGKMTEDEWREKFPKITVDFNVDVKIMHTGTIQ